MLNVAHVTNDVKIFFDDFMSNIDVFFCDVISLLAQVFIVSFDRAYKEVSTKNIEHFLWLSFCAMTVPSKSTVPATLTFDL